eukprot:1152084-Pelagomonas_calceolata.AAC.13
MHGGSAMVAAYTVEFHTVELLTVPTWWISGPDWWFMPLSSSFWPGHRSGRGTSGKDTLGKNTSVKKSPGKKISGKNTPGKNRRTEAITEPLELH